MKGEEEMRGVCKLVWKEGCVCCCSNFLGFYFATACVLEKLNENRIHGKENDRQFFAKNIAIKFYEILFLAMDHGPQNKTKKQGKNISDFFSQMMSII